MDAIVNAFAQGLESLRQIALHIPGLQTLASAPFLFRPLVMVLVLGLVCGLVGVLINLRLAEFTAEATVHAVFPGIVAGAVYGGVDAIIPAASGVALLATLALTLISHRHYGAAAEAGTAVVLTGFFAFGIILSLAKGDMSGQLEALMFGRLLEVTDGRLLQALVVSLIACILVVVTWKEQVMYAFDRLGARASGLPALALDFTLNLAIAAVVVAASSAIGTLLVIGYLVVPGAAARLLATNLKSMVALAICFGVGGGYLGMLILTVPVSHPLSPQAVVALSVFATYLLALAIRGGRLLRTKLAVSHAEVSRARKGSVANAV